MAGALSFNNVGMTFPDGTRALGGATFDVNPGEFVTVVGPSGCGKSTLLRIASNLETATEGACNVDRDSIGYVFQDATLLPWRTVAKNIELLAELHGVDKAEREERVRSVIDLVGLAGFEDKYPKQLSGGMKMRASLARSLVMKPRVFLFDEPFGALDEITRERLNDELLRLFQLEGFAGLFITHSISEAVYMSTKVLVMSSRPGRIVASFDVPFEYPRAHSLRYEPKFAELCGEVLHCPAGSTRMTDLKAQVAVTPPSTRRPDDAPVESVSRVRVSDIVGPAVVFVLFIAFWYALSTKLLPEQKRFLLPTPHKVLKEGFFTWEAGEQRGLFPILRSMWSSIQVAIVGLIITIIIGTVLATAMATRRWVERATWPYLVALQSAPILAMTPLIRALIDGVQTQRILVVVLIAFFPIVNNTLFGLLSVEKSQHELFTLHGASKWTRLTKLQFPAAMPNIFVGLRISAGLSVIGAVVGDFYFRQGGVVGIGAQIDIYRGRLWGSELIAAILLASAFGLVVFIVFGFLSKLAIGKWHTTTRGQ